MKKSKQNPYVESLSLPRRALIMFGKCSPWLIFIGMKTSQTFTGAQAVLGIAAWALIIYICAWLFGLLLTLFYKLRNINHPFYALPMREVIRGLALRVGPWSYSFFGIFVLSGLIIGVIEAV